MTLSAVTTTPAADDNVIRGRGPARTCMDCQGLLPSGIRMVKGQVPIRAPASSVTNPANSPVRINGLSTTSLGFDRSPTAKILHHSFGESPTAS